VNDSGIIAAFIGAVALLIAAIVALIPYLGVLHRLERVVNILEKVDDPEHRITLIVLRDQLIERLRPRGFYGPLPFGFLSAVISFLLAAVSIGIGVAQRTIWSDGGEAPASGPLVVAGIVLMLLGLVSFLIGLVNARRRRRAMDWLKTAQAAFAKEHARLEDAQAATKPRPRARKKS
jgi:amino acid transporter